MSEVIIQAKEVCKFYGNRRNLIKALGPVDLEIKRGDFAVILGRSGSGKSTLLNVMAGLDKVTSGVLEVEGKNLTKANPKQLAKYRSDIGVIFQFYNLLPNLNTLQNVMIGAWAGGKNASQEEAMDLLKQFGLEHRIKADVKTLSGGEKQRVAICRALMGGPSILFCDEPTGALDSQNEVQVKDILVDLNKKKGLTIVMVTHNDEFASLANVVIKMKDGQIVESKINNQDSKSLPASANQLYLEATEKAEEKAEEKVKMEETKAIAPVKK
jgi:putative ABC transport system ATP-binding protein